MKLPKDLAKLEALAAEVAEAIKEARCPYSVGARIILHATVAEVDLNDRTLPVMVVLDGDPDDPKWLNPDQIAASVASSSTPTRASGRSRAKRTAS